PPPLFLASYHRAHRDLPSFPTRRSSDLRRADDDVVFAGDPVEKDGERREEDHVGSRPRGPAHLANPGDQHPRHGDVPVPPLVTLDRKSTRLNSSHVEISYAVFCLKKKKD